MRLVIFSGWCCSLLCLVQPCRAGSTDSLIVSFDAVISEIDGAAQSLDLPFTLNIGDRIEGEIVFDSRAEALLQLQGNTTILSNLSLTIGGVAIHNLFNVSTTNDGGFIGPIDPPPAEPPSSIYFGYLPTTNSIPGWAGSGLNVPWNAQLLLLGESGTLDKPEGLLDFDDWNRLETVRDLTMQFGFPNTVTVTATLGDFTAVPEPSSLAIAFFAFVGIVICVLSRRDRSRRENSMRLLFSSWLPLNRFSFCVSLLLCLSTFCAAKCSSAAPGDLLFKLTAPSPQLGGGFGEELAAADGNIVVGEPKRLVNGTAFVGQAYIFDAQTGAIKFTLEEPEPINRSTFGSSLAAGDGAVYVGGGGDGGRGRVYAYDSNTGAMRYQIEGPDGGDDAFASSIAYGGGGLLVTAPSYSLNADLFAVGQAYLYDTTNGQPDLTISNPEPSRQEAFGSGIPVAIFGNKLAVGCLADNSFDGRVWIFDRDSGEVDFTLENPNPDTHPPLHLPDWFGWSVAANEDIIVVGAQEDSTSGVKDSGTAYVFDSQTGALLHTLLSPQIEENGEFGRSVAVTPDGNVLVGAWHTTVDGIDGAGRVYLFDGQTGNLLLDIPNPEPETSKVFGWSVAALENQIVVGAPAGEAVYVFSSVPEPGTISLAAVGLVVAALQLRRRGRNPFL